MKDICRYWYAKRAPHIGGCDPSIPYLIQSPNWKERCQGEYLFIKEKADKLKAMIEKYAKGILDFKPNCSIELLTAQLNAMTEYLNILEVRSHLENF